jgi:hypothetical protein
MAGLRDEEKAVDLYYIQAEGTTASPVTAVVGPRDNLS